MFFGVVMWGGTRTGALPRVLSSTLLQGTTGSLCDPVIQEF